MELLGIYRTGVAIDGLFKDVTKENPLGDAIKTLVEYGIIKGYTDGNFNYSRSRCSSKKSIDSIKFNQ